MTDLVPPRGMTIDLDDIRPSRVTCVDFQGEATFANPKPSMTVGGLKITGTRNIETDSGPGPGLTVVERDRPVHAHDWVPMKIRFLNLFESRFSRMLIELPAPARWVSISLGAHRGLDKEYFGPPTPTYSWVAFLDSKKALAGASEFLESAPQRGSSAIRTYTTWGEDICYMEVTSLFAAGVYVWQVCHSAEAT
jgi:hypothetical protein